MAVMTRDLADLAATRELADWIAARLRPGDAVLLEGPLGAGKTELARQVLRRLAEDGGLEVPSPSFTLVQTYSTAIGEVHHLDLWRLAGPEELAELGWDDMLADVVLVEWAERLGEARPPGALTVQLHPTGERSRMVMLGGWVGRS
jgi:tRNA threonylcarbamoyladenosine biosynthesis protein TsaE